MKISVLPQPVGFFKFMLDLSCIISIQGIDNSYLFDFVIYTFRIGLSLDAYEMISFQCGVMIDTQASCTF